MRAHFSCAGVDNQERSESSAQKGSSTYTYRADRREGQGESDPPTEPEVQALRDTCEELADDVRALSALVHALRGRWLRVAIQETRTLWPRDICSQSFPTRRRRLTSPDYQ